LGELLAKLKTLRLTRKCCVHKQCVQISLSFEKNFSRLSNYTRDARSNEFVFMQIVPYFCQLPTKAEQDD